MIRIYAKRYSAFLKLLLGILVTLTWVKLLCMGIALILPFLPEPIGSRAELFTEGANQTLSLTVVAGGLGLVLGLILSLTKLYAPLAIRLVASGLIGVLRGTPLLVQIFFVYYAVPALLPAFKLNEFLAALVALALNVGAYNAETIRAGILAIPKGQFEAAFSLRLTRWNTLRWVILPQAFKVVIPPLFNNFVALLKDSSLASSIGLLELSLVGNRITSETFLPVPVLMTVASIYLLQNLILSSVMYVLEQRLKIV